MFEKLIDLLRHENTFFLAAENYVTTDSKIKKSIDWTRKSDSNFKFLKN